MVSSIESTPSTPIFSTDTVVKPSRKRQRDPGPEQGTAQDDRTLARAIKHACLRAGDGATPAESGRLPKAPSIARWPELYVDSIVDAQACDRTLVAAKMLHPANVSTLVLGHGQRIGVVLGLHGLSAGPWQYAEIGEAYARLGLDVYTPRMIGHGLRKDGEPFPEGMPDLHDEAAYDRYAQVVFDSARRYAQLHDLPLLIAAHSAGAVLAATLIQNHPKAVAGQVYINPLQAPSSRGARLKFFVARLVRNTAWGRRCLQWARHVFVANVTGDTWPGYPSVPLSKIFPVLNRARTVWRSFVTTSIPTMLFVSDADRTCDPVPTLKSAKKFFPHCRVHRFGRHDGVGHAMVSAIENPRADIRQIIYDKSGSFLVDCARAARPRSIENTPPPAP